MRTALAITCVLAVSLAGCGSKSSLAPYTLGETDLPEAFVLADLTNESWSMFAGPLGMESNPGEANAKALTLLGIRNATSLYVAVFEVRGGEGYVISGATRFTTRDTAGWHIQENLECGTSTTILQNGRIVAATESFGLTGEEQAKVNAAMDLVRLRTGSAAPC